MHSESIQQIWVGTGPGPRGEECEICMEEIKDEDASISHVSCANTFHRGCLDEWTKSNYVQLEMYDYMLQPTGSSMNDFPTPALVHRLQTRRSEFSAWIADYFLRQRQAQTLSNDQIVSRIMDCYLLFDRASPRNQNPLAEGLRIIHGEIRPGESATDLEIIGNRGDRRPRPSVVEFYMKQPDQARAWLRRRLAATQTELGLDLDRMHDFRRRFEKEVRREIKRRRSESPRVQGGRSTSETIAGSL